MHLPGPLSASWTREAGNSFMAKVFWGRPDFFFFLFLSYRMRMCDSLCQRSLLRCKKRNQDGDFRSHVLEILQIQEREKKITAVGQTTSRKAEI